MYRNRFRTPDDEVAATRNRVLWLLQQASPSPSNRVLFAQLMNEASAKGLSWIDGLEYAVQRHGPVLTAGESAE